MIIKRPNSMRNSENVRFPTKMECEPNYDIHYKTEIYSSTLTPIHIRLKIIRTIKKSLQPMNLRRWLKTASNYLCPEYFFFGSFIIMYCQMVFIVGQIVFTKAVLKHSVNFICE